MAAVTISPVVGDTTRDASAEPQTRNYARIAEQTWIWSIVGYTIVRFAIAWGAFSEHGANVWIFGLLDVGTAWPYAKAVAAVCKRAAGAQWARLPLPLSVALVSFFAPYAYLWFAAGEMPAGVRVGMAICVSVLLLAATAGVLTKTRKLRNADAVDTDMTVDLTDSGATVLAAVAGDHDGDVVDLRSDGSGHDLIIDLTGDEVTLERPALHQ